MQQTTKTAKAVKNAKVTMVAQATKPATVRSIRTDNTASVAVSSFSTTILFSSFANVSEP
jgi:hypothetical protein